MNGTSCNYRGMDNNNNNCYYNYYHHSPPCKIVELTLDEHNR